MTQLAKRLKGRIDSMYRYLVLNYQLGAVSRAIEALDRDDRRQLLELANRKTQGTGQDTALSAAEAFSRIRSENTQLRLHSLAQWLGAVYVETRDSIDGDLQDLHRRVLRTLRTLRDSVPSPAPAKAAA